MSTSSRRVAVALITVCVLVAPSVPVLASVFDPDVPMVARATEPARRAASAVTIGTTIAPNEAPMLAAEAVRLTNLQRAAAGYPPLVVHPAVVAAATAHSEDMAARGRMSHIGSDGSDLGTRLTRAGFTWWTWAENVAAGQRTAPDVVAAWMGSPGHRANILGPAFTTIGIGVAIAPDGTRFWTMDLAA